MLASKRDIVIIGLQACIDSLGDSSFVQMLAAHLGQDTTKYHKYHVEDLQWRSTCRASLVDDVWGTHACGHGLDPLEACREGVRSK